VSGREREREKERERVAPSLRVENSSILVRQKEASLPLFWVRIRVRVWVRV
jgi:hypothetical protein